MIFRLVFLLCVGAAAFPSHADTIFANEWTQANSKHFVVYTDMGESKAKSVAIHLELVRKAVDALIDSVSISHPTPVTVVVVEDEDNFAALGFSTSNRSSYVQTPNNTYIVVRDIFTQTEKKAAAVHYVHSLLRNQQGTRLPRWYHVGVASFFYPMEEFRGILRIGVRQKPFGREKYADMGAPDGSLLRYGTANVPAEDRLTSLQETVSDQWSAENVAENTRFSHHLFRFMINRDRVSFGQALDRYSRDRQDGASALSAFNANFDVEGFAAYLERTPYPILSLDIGAHSRDIPVTVTTATGVKISRLLGDIAMHAGAYQFAEHAFRRVIKDAESYALGKAGLARLARIEGKLEQAEWHLQTALRRKPETAALYLALGRLWRDRALAEKSEKIRLERIERSRRALVRSWELDDKNPEIYAMLGEHFTLFSTDTDRAIELLEIAEGLVPSSGEIQVLLAKAYLNAGLESDAVRVLSMITTWPFLEPLARNRVVAMDSRLSPTN